VQQSQEPHLARLLPQGQRTRHAHQVVAEGAGLVPVLAHTACQHGGQHGRQIGIARQPVLVEQGLGAGKQVGIQSLKQGVHGKALAARNKAPVWPAIHRTATAAVAVR